MSRVEVELSKLSLLFVVLMAVIVELVSFVLSIVTQYSKDMFVCNAIKDRNAIGKKYR